MNTDELKQLIINSLNEDVEPRISMNLLEKEGVVYDFNDDFEDRILCKLFGSHAILEREYDFTQFVNRWFSKIIISGAAAVILMFVTIFISEGNSFSLDSLIGLGDTYEEGMICLLGGF